MPPSRSLYQQLRDGEITPEEYDRARLSEREGLVPTKDVGVGFRSSPVPERPSPEDAARALTEAKAQRRMQVGKEGEGGRVTPTEARGEAGADVYGRGVVEETPSREDTSAAALAARALQAIKRQRVRREAPPPASEQVGDVARSAGRHAVRMAAAPLSAVAGPLTGQLPRTASDKVVDAVFGAEDEGAYLEPEAFQAVRVLATAAAAPIQEAILGAPVPGPNIRNIVQKMKEGAPFLEAIDPLDEAGPMSVGEFWLGLEAGERLPGAPQSGNPVKDWAFRVVEKIRTGAGLESDVGASFRKHLPTASGGLVDEDQAEWAGWTLGLLLDVVTPWESAVVAPGKAASSFARSMAEVNALVPDAVPKAEVMLSAFIDRMKHTDVEMMDNLGRRLGQMVVDGTLAVEDIPEAILARANIVTHGEHGRGLLEVASAAGVSPAPAVPARQAERLGSGEFEIRPTQGHRPPVKGRTRLPEGFKAGSMDEFWAKLKGHSPGYDLDPGSGFKALKHLDPKQSPASPKYILQSRSGPQAQGSLPEMLDLMVQRAAHGGEGDRVWYSHQRPVVSWGSRGGQPKLTTNHLFGSDAERAVVAKRATAADATPKVEMLRGANVKVDLFGAQIRPKQVWHEILDGVYRAPAKGSPLPVTEEQAIFVDAIREGARVYGREIIGKDGLVPLGNGALVTRHEAAKINERVRSTFERAGIDLQAVAERGVTTDAEDAAFVRLGRQYGVDMSAGFRPIRQRDLHSAILTKEGGVAAWERWAVRGTRGFADNLLVTLASFGDDRNRFALWAGQRISSWHAVIGDLTTKVVDPKRFDLNPQNQAILKWGEAQLADVGAGLAKEIEEVRIRDGNGKLGWVSPQVLAQQVVDGARPVARVEREWSDLVTWRGSLTPGEVAQLQKEMAAELPYREPWMVATDPAEALGGIVDWGRRTQFRAHRTARDWVASHLPLSKANDVPYAKALQALPPEVLGRAYDEFFHEGLSKGPALRDALSRLVGPDQVALAMKADHREAMFRFILTARMERVVERVAERFIEANLAVPSTPRLAEVFSSRLRGRDVGRDAAGRLVFDMTGPERAFVDVTLNKWGLKPGSFAVVKPSEVLPDVLVPEFIERDLQRWMQLGIAAPADLLSVKGTALGKAKQLLSIYKEQLLTGAILPRVSYAVAQMFGLLPVMVTTVGLEGTASAGSTFAKHPLMVGELMKRLSATGPYLPPVADARSVFRTSDDRLFTVGELADAVEKHGLGASEARVESARDVGVIFDRATNRSAMGYVKRAHGVYKDAVKDFASAFDQAGRLSVFLDEVHRGSSVEQAALVARRALLDYTELTDFEQKYMRLAFTFYGFMRKSTDAYFAAMMRHPDRIGAQARLARAGVGTFGSEDVEDLVALDSQDLARTTAMTWDEVAQADGTDHPVYGKLLLQSQPSGVFEVLGLVGALLGAASFGPSGTESRQYVAGATTPYIQSLLSFFFDVNAGTGADPTKVSSSRIHPLLIDTPVIGPMIMSMTNAGPRRLDADSLQGGDASASFTGYASRWHAGAGEGSLEESLAGRKAWHQLRIWIGGQTYQLGRWAQAFGVMPDPDGLDLTIGQQIGQLFFTKTLRKEEVFSDWEMLEAEARSLRNETEEFRDRTNTPR